MASLAVTLVALGAAMGAAGAEQCDDVVQMQLQRRRDSPVIPGLGAGGKRGKHQGLGDLLWETDGKREGSIELTTWVAKLGVTAVLFCFF